MSKNQSTSPSTSPPWERVLSEAKKAEEEGLGSLCYFWDARHRQADGGPAVYFDVDHLGPVGHATGGLNGTILDGTVDVPVKYPGAVLLRISLEADLLYRQGPVLRRTIR